MPCAMLLSLVPRLRDDSPLDFQGRLVENSTDVFGVASHPDPSRGHPGIAGLPVHQALALSCPIADVVLGSTRPVISELLRLALEGLVES